LLDALAAFFYSAPDVDVIVPGFGRDDGEFRIWQVFPLPNTFFVFNPVVFNFKNM
jgi:hypothetical protein